MSKFKVEQKVDLSYLGEAWKDCYLIFMKPTYKDVKDFIAFGESEDPGVVVDKAVIKLKELFVSGKGINEKGYITDIYQDDLEELPVDVLINSMQELNGTPSPN